MDATQEECLQIVLVDLILHSPLKLEQRGILEEHHRKGAHADVMHRIICLCFLAVIRNETEPFREHFSQDRGAEMFLRMRHGETVAYTGRKV